MRKSWIAAIFILTTLILTSAYYLFLRTPDCAPAGPEYPPEVPITLIELSEPLDNRQAEVSGMDWYGDYLIILPQFFDLEDDRAIFAIPKEAILDYLQEEQPTPLKAIKIPVEDQFFGDDFPENTFEGYEAIAFAGSRLYLNIETSLDRQMQGFIVAGEIAPDLSKVVLDIKNIQPIPLQQQIFNYANETLLVAGNRVLSLYEANGSAVNPGAVAQVFDSGLNLVEELPLSHIEYRVTDATRLADDNTFWVINHYSLSSIRLHPGKDPIAQEFGKGCTHAFYSSVERLIQLQYNPQAGLSLTDTPPIQLELTGVLNSRNWEALVRLDDRGFLIATDKFPGTILAFVPYPEE